MERFEGRIAVVAGTGIGRKPVRVRQLAAAGAHVVDAHVRRAPELAYEGALVVEPAAAGGMALDV